MGEYEEKDMVKEGKVRGYFDEEHKILVVFVVPKADLTIEDARVCTAWMQKLTGNIPRPMLGDFGNMKSQTKECRDYFTKDPKHLQSYSAIAILVNNPLTRMLANFFIGINKPPKPTRLFDDREKAIQWLVEQGKLQQ